MTRALLTTILLFALFLPACTGGYTGEAKARWNTDQAILDRAEHAKNARDFEASAAAYEELWQEAIQPYPPEGTLGDYFVMMGLTDLARKWPPAQKRIEALEPPLATLLTNGQATRRQAMAWTNLVTIGRLDAPIVDMAEKLHANPDMRKALDLDPYFRTMLMKRLRVNGRDELTVAFAPNPGAAILSGVADTAGNALGTVVSPILYPIYAR